MARGVQLRVILDKVRAEASQSQNVAVGRDVEPVLLQKIQRTQRILYEGFDWPFMMIDVPIALQAGQRYYDLPQDPAFPGLDLLDYESIQHLTINYSGKPVPLERGVDWEEYAQYNSDSGERASPARRWDVTRSSLTKEQLEIWPIPSDNTQIVVVRGKKKLRPLVDFDDRADLDDDLIALTVAAELLRKAGSKEAPSVENTADTLRKMLQANNKTSSIPLNFAQTGNGNFNANRGKTIIRIGSQTN